MKGYRKVSPIEIAMYERVKMFIDSKAYTIQAFSKLLGMSYQSIYKSLYTYHSFTLKTHCLLLKSIPSLNARWLLLGDGLPFENPLTISELAMNTYVSNGEDAVIETTKLLLDTMV